jgi:hypothetical protein
VDSQKLKRYSLNSGMGLCFSQRFCYIWREDNFYFNVVVLAKMPTGLTRPTYPVIDPSPTMAQTTGAFRLSDYLTVAGITTASTVFGYVVSGSASAG